VFNEQASDVQSAGSPPGRHARPQEEQLRKKKSAKALGEKFAIASGRHLVCSHPLTLSWRGAALIPGVPLAAFHRVVL
jgi:hypothetical protein